MDSNLNPLKTEQNVKNDIINPWSASSIFDFCYFCCPECDEKSKDKQEFVNHASAYHKGVSLKKVIVLTIESNALKV